MQGLVTEGSAASGGCLLALKARAAAADLPLLEMHDALDVAVFVGTASHETGTADKSTAFTAAAIGTTAHAEVQQSACSMMLPSLNMQIEPLKRSLSYQMRWWLLTNSAMLAGFLHVPILAATGDNHLPFLESFIFDHDCPDRLFT